MTKREWLVIEDSRKYSVFAPDEAKSVKGYIPRDVAENILCKDLGGNQWFTAEESGLLRASPEWRTELPPDTASAVYIKQETPMSESAGRPDEVESLRKVKEIAGSAWKTNSRDIADWSEDMAHILAICDPGYTTCPHGYTLRSCGICNTNPQRSEHTVHRLTSFAIYDQAANAIVPLSPSPAGPDALAEEIVAACCKLFGTGTDYAENLRVRVYDDELGMPLEEWANELAALLRSRPAQDRDAVIEECAAVAREHKERMDKQGKREFGHVAAYIEGTILSLKSDAAMSQQEKRDG